jgi:hypothetical protein
MYVVKLTCNELERGNFEGIVVGVIRIQVYFKLESVGYVFDCCDAVGGVPEKE